MTSPLEAAGGECVAVESPVDASVSGMCRVVRVGGEMDYESAPFFRARLLAEIAQDERRVVLDLSAMAFCDSAGLNVLAEIWREAHVTGVVVVLACVAPSLRRMLSITGLSDVLPAYATVAEAEAAGGRS
ncbi:STAS domain-containing protein [Streptomyces sp. NPDC007172]|uniref:STAS domain-containing protein n=1 Tax=Streptomyces sp. NPDC007172 TaxID=3364776 RepID=UPI0036A677B7